MAKRRIANTLVDPTLNTVQLEIKGKQYTLCFDLGALAEAERHFMLQGEKVNLLSALTEVNLSSVLILFPCAVRKFHPDLSFGEAQAIIKSDMRSIFAIAAHIWLAWNAAMPEPDENQGAKENPPEP